MFSSEMAGYRHLKMRLQHERTTMAITPIEQLGEKPITAAELADWLGTTVENVAQMRFRGIGPKFVKAGRRVYYMPSAVREWVETNTRAMSDS